jgi:DNA-binding CsgD family transcriptional regulator
MPRSSRLRHADWRALHRLFSECRDLGDDHHGWRNHLVSQLARLVDADLGFCGEMTGVRDQRPATLGVSHWGWENGFDQKRFLETFARLEHEPSTFATFTAYLERAVRKDGVCHTRRELTPDRQWYTSIDYQELCRPIGYDHSLWCFRVLNGGARDEFSGIVLNRRHGARDFQARETVLVRELHAEIARAIGGPLARYTDPSPRALSPRARQVLACLLEGEGDKQIAARLNLSRFTVNHYAKLVFRHFGTRSRAELQGRWIRRGWGAELPGPPSTR